MSNVNLLARPGRLICIADSDWKLDYLPKDDIRVPFDELPDPDTCDSLPTTGRSQETLKELESKWTDLALVQLINKTEKAPMPQN